MAASEGVAAGVWVTDLETARRDAPQLVEPHLGTWLTDRSVGGTGGTFVHVAAGVRVAAPLQTFFGRDAERLAPDHRTLIVAEAGSDVSYIEGCSAPLYTPHSERNSVVEVVVGPGAVVRHTTIQNWSANVHNTVERHANVHHDGRVEWVDAVLGSRSTKTKCVTRLAGSRASGSFLSLLIAGSAQTHEVAATMLHAAPDTSSAMETRMIGSSDGVATSRHAIEGAVEMAAESKARTLRLDGDPQLRHQLTDQTGVGLRPTVASFEEASIEASHLRYLMQRGLSRNQAMAVIVGGFIGPITRTLPLEYSVEWDRLIELHLDGAIG